MLCADPDILGLFTSQLERQLRDIYSVAYERARRERHLNALDSDARVALRARAARERVLPAPG
jgi:hypothetical protein